MLYFNLSSGVAVSEVLVFQNLVVDLNLKFKGYYCGFNENTFTVLFFLHSYYIVHDLGL